MKELTTLLKKNIRYIAVSFLILIIILLTIYSRWSNEGIKPSTGSYVHEVVLTEDGYKPETLTIKKGATVTFSTKRNQPHWPASNLHPIHDIYPEFDTKEPIEASKTWSFRFDKAGSWKYHDHLAPYYTGTINVVK